MCDGCAEVGARIATTAGTDAACRTCEDWREVLLTDADLVPCPMCRPDAYGAAVAELYPTEEA